MAEKIVSDDATMFVEWGSRGFSFSVEKDEFQNLSEHALKCGDAAVAVLRAIELAVRNTSCPLDEAQLQDAIAGASFLSGMSRQMHLAAAGAKS